MTRHEAAGIAAFLDELGDRFGNDGCNDLTLPDTPENRAMILAAEAHALGDDASGRVGGYDGKLMTNNMFVIDYLKSKLMQEHSLADSDLPKW